MPTVEIRVKLPNDRAKTGTLELKDPLTGLTVYGPVPVLGRAARNDAEAHNNPNIVAHLPYGHTPTGTYSVPIILSSGGGTSYPADKYGNAGVIRLEPTSGEAAIAKANGRIGLLIHAGRQPPGAASAGQLKPTNGCIRMLESDLAGLIVAIKNSNATFPADLVVSVGPAGPLGGEAASAGEGDPPPLDNSHPLP